MTLYRLGEVAPVVADPDRAFVAPDAQVIGDVRIGLDVSIWFGAVLRGDNEAIAIGEGTNVQDRCVFHTDPGFPLSLGREVTVGHAAILHGCTVEDGALIGMGATVLNGARIGAGALVGANALVTEGKEIPPGAMVLGQPGKVVKTLDEDAIARLRRTAGVYREKLARYRAGLEPIG